MKKMSFNFGVIVSVFILSLQIYAQESLFDYVDDISISEHGFDLEVTFSGTGWGNTIDIYTWDETQIITNTKQAYNGQNCMQNKRYMIDRFKLEIKPEGLYEVAVYTNNLRDDDCDNVPDSYNGISWEDLSQYQKANWISERAGLRHTVFGGYYVPIKIWCQYLAGPLTADCDTAEMLPPPVSIEYGGMQIIAQDSYIHDYDDPETAYCWFGTTDSRGGASHWGFGEWSENYYPGSYQYIPEKLAIIENSYMPGITPLGTYRKVIAGTRTGIEIFNTDGSPRRLPIGIGCDLMLAGKGTYEGTIIFALASN